jgi:MFS family permease
MHIPPALKNRKFLILWLGLMVSIAGSQMQVAAIHWHIRELTGTPDPLALGGIGLARILPVIVFSVFGGVFADTYNRRIILFITQTSMALTAIGLAVLTFSGQTQIWHIYLLTALQAAAVAFDSPARQAIVPNIVLAKDLPNAFSLNSIALNVGSVAGPVLSGVVIATLGQGYAYFFNAISFLAVILALLAIGPIPQDFKAASGVSLSAIKDGFHFIFSRKIILSTMVMDFFATFFAAANTMLPIIARDILRVGEVGYGLLGAASSAGSVMAAFVVSQLPAIRRQGPVFLVAVIIFGLATIAFGLSQTFWLAFIALALMGAADSVSTIVRNTIRQLNTPDHIRGRMTSINQIFFQGGPQLGEVRAGLVASAFGVPFAIITGGAWTIIAALLIMAKWPVLRTYDGSEPVSQAAPATAD